MRISDWSSDVCSSDLSSDCPAGLCDSLCRDLWRRGAGCRTCPGDAGGVPRERSWICLISQGPRRLAAVDETKQLWTPRKLGRVLGYSKSTICRTGSTGLEHGRTRGASLERPACLQDIHPYDPSTHTTAH